MRAELEPIKYYLYGEVVIYTILMVFVFVLNSSSQLDTYVTKWISNCTTVADNYCVRMPELDRLFVVRELMFVVSIVVVKTVFLLVELFFSEKSVAFLHYVGYTMWSSLAIIFVSQICGLRDGLQLLIVVAYVIAMKALSAYHNYVVHHGIELDDTQVLFLIATIMIAMAFSVVFVSMVKEALESESVLVYPAIISTSAAVYCLVHTVANYYFYYIKIPKEYSTISQLRGDSNAKVQKVKMYGYLAKYDPTTVVNGELFIRIIQFVWVAVLCIIHLLMPERTISYEMKEMS